MLYYGWTIERLEMEVSSMDENESIEFKENYTEKIYYVGTKNGRQ